MSGRSDMRSNPGIRALISATDEGLVALDGAGVVRLMNEAAQEILGLARVRAVGRPVEELGVPELADRVRRSIRTGRTPAKAFQFELRDRHVLARASRFASGTDSGIAVTLHDATELNRVQEQSEAILASTGDGIVLFSPEDRITYANPAACEMLGCTAKKLVGKTISPDALLGIEAPRAPTEQRCSNIVHCVRTECPAHDSDDPRCWLVSGTPGPDGTPVPFAEKRVTCAQCDVYKGSAASLDGLGTQEYREVPAGKSQRYVLKARTSPVIDAHGAYIGMVLTLHDITAEREIAQMKNEFVSTVSHELRTPLTSIKGYVDLILDGDVGDITDTQREFLGIVKENADRLVALINGMLDIASIEAGRVHLEVEPLAVADMISDAVDAFRIVLEQTGRVIRTRIPAGLPRVAADRHRMGQVMLNFVSNALKYSPRGGDVMISARLAEGFVHVSVKDHGMGITREDQQRLFTKFFRSDNAMTREIGGTGLGLSICKDIIELHDGRVWVRSKPGEGSTFSFSLPIAAKDMVRTPYLVGPTETGGKVLVVDRDPYAADLIETYLVKRGYDVIKAHSGQEAVDAAIREQPLLITLDVLLDDRDGFELLQELKERPETAKIPIVVLSIVCDDTSCRFAAADYLEKPIDQSRLLQVIDGIVGSSASPVALVVDDDRSMVRVLMEMLRTRGFAVAAAFDGLEALAAIKARKPDVMLLDLKMPNMDGYEVIQRVKTTPEWKEIPIIVMTGHRIDSDRVDVLNLAVTQLAKPLSPELIADRVEQLIGSRRAPSGVAPATDGNGSRK